MSSARVKQADKPIKSAIRTRQRDNGPNARDEMDTMENVKKEIKKQEKIQQSEQK